MNLSNFNEFIENFDKEGFVIVLAGKRKVLPADEDSIFNLGQLLAKSTKHARFRSGNAEGADELFTRGFCRVSPERMEVVIPYTGHRKNFNVAGTTYSLDKVDLNIEKKLVTKAKEVSTSKNSIEQFFLKENRKMAENGRYFLRDTMMVLGTKEIKKADFAIFYDDLRNPKLGGTGHTIQICEKNGVLKINQKIWLKWL